MKLTSTLAACALLSACASGYSQFYTPWPGATPEAIAERRANPPPAMPEIDRARAVDDELFALYARNAYVPVGYSSFNSGRTEGEAGAIKQAQLVGADRVVIINPQHTETISTSIPITTPTSTTSYTSSNATAYSGGYSATAYGNSTTTTYGSQTTYVPMTVRRYDYGAVYFVKRKHAFGAHYRDPNDNERQAMESNRGVVLTVIVNDSPAFRADLLANDIVTEIEDQPIYGEAGFSDALGANLGRTVTLTVVRNGKSLTKSVALGTY